MFDHFCLDLVGLVLSEFVWSVLFGLSQTEEKKTGLKYRVAAQLKTFCCPPVLVDSEH